MCRFKLLVACLCAVAGLSRVQAQELGAVPSGQPRILAQTIRVRIDHSQQSLRGDWTLRLAGNPLAGDTTLDFDLLDGTIEGVYLNNQPHDAFEYKPHPNQSPEQSRQVDSKRLSIHVPSVAAVAPEYSIRVVYTDDHLYGTAVNPQGASSSLGQITIEDAFAHRIAYYPRMANASEKADLYFTTNLPGGYVVASGKLVSVKGEDGGFRTFHYRAEHPSGPAPYPFAVAKYAMLEGVTHDEKTRLRVFFFPEHQQIAEQCLTLLPDTLASSAEKLGAFPFPTFTLVDLKPKEGRTHFAGRGVVFLSNKLWSSFPPDAPDTSPFGESALTSEIHRQWPPDAVVGPPALLDEHDYEGRKKRLEDLVAEIMRQIPIAARALQQYDAQFKKASDAHPGRQAYHEAMAQTESARAALAGVEKQVAEKRQDLARAQQETQRALADLEGQRRRAQDELLGSYEDRLWEAENEAASPEEIREIRREYTRFQNATNLRYDTLQISLKQRRSSAEQTARDAIGPLEAEANRIQSEQIGPAMAKAAPFQAFLDQEQQRRQSIAGRVDSLHQELAGAKKRLENLPKPRPAEDIAQGRLKMAKMLLNRNAEAGRRRLEEVVAKYPRTKAANEAAAILEGLGED